MYHVTCVSSSTMVDESVSVVGEDMDTGSACHLRDTKVKGGINNDKKQIVILTIRN